MLLSTKKSLLPIMASSAIALLMASAAMAKTWYPNYGWKDSYAVDGVCYCDSNGYDHNLDEKSAPTPVGIKNVVDICNDIRNTLGEGAQQNRIPYNDIQCGNGPANDAADEVGCPGRVDIGPEGCNQIGPKWDLASVYGGVNEEETPEEETPEEETTDALDRSSWTLSASHNDSQTGYAIDAQEDTRWTTGQAQRMGQSFTIDLKKSSSFNRIEMLTQYGNKSVNDHPRVYELYISNDGNDWGAAVAMGEGDSDGLTVINLDINVTARFVKIVQTGSDNYHWWSIHNINLYAASGTTEEEGNEEEIPDNGDYNKTIDATGFSSESHPSDQNKVRDMGNKVGYIKDGTSISFADFTVPNNPIPTSITMTYSSAGAGGIVKFVSESNNSDSTAGVTLGEFVLPRTGDWNKFETSTFDVSEDNFDLNDIQIGNQLTLEFINADTSNYLFDIVSFTINN